MSENKSEKSNIVNPKLMDGVPSEMRQFLQALAKELSSGQTIFIQRTLMDRNRLAMTRHQGRVPLGPQNIMRTKLKMATLSDAENLHQVIPSYWLCPVNHGEGDSG